MSAPPAESVAEPVAAPVALPELPPSIAATAAAVVPRRTDKGQAALLRRSRDLTQRQRTALFMVDGKRSVDIVLALATRAGASTTDFSALVDLGMVETPGIADPSVLTDPSQPPNSVQGESSLPPDDLATDAPLREARALLIRAVREEAPIAGALTLRRLKRAAAREELVALLDEVEHRLRKPHRRLIAAELMKRVRHLLTLPPATQLPR